MVMQWVGVDSGVRNSPNRSPGAASAEDKTANHTGPTSRAPLQTHVSHQEDAEQDNSAAEQRHHQGDEFEGH